MNVQKAKKHQWKSFLLWKASIILWCLPFVSFSQDTEIELATSEIQGDSVLVDTIVIEQVALDTIPLLSTVILEETLSEQEKKDLETDKTIESKLKAIQNQVPLIYNKKIKGFIDYFSIRNRNYLITMERRKNLYFPLFEEILRKYNMPEEIKYLSIVESGLNPMAISRAGAAGLWQFMPGTGKEMGLVINEYVDERLDPYKSTVAACQYLTRMYRAFGDWELALASYNCGPGVVKRAVRQSGKNTFWKIYDFLPSETRGYVPQFVAVTYVMNNLPDYEMDVKDSILYPMETDTITIRQFVNLHVLCEKLDFCYEDFVKINPAIRTNILPDNFHYPIRIPKEKKLEYYLNQHEISECVKVSTTPIEVNVNDKRKYTSGSVAYRHKIIHTVKSGEVLGKIASKYGTTVTQIKTWNNLKSNTIRIGQKLVIYKVKYSNGTTTPSTVQKPTPKYYYVQPGDTLYGISKKHGGLSVEKIKQLNNLSDSNIKVGQKLQLN